MCGIDSLHIQVQCSIGELLSFIRKEKLMLIKEYQTMWTTRFKLILPKGEKIQVVTHKRGSCRLEFGGLYYSKNSTKKLQLIRSLTCTFFDWEMQRLDFACDLKIPFADIDIALPKQHELYDGYKDSFYINRKTKQKTLTWITYDKAKRMKLFSFPLTRIELRLFRGSIRNRKLANCFNDIDTFNKSVSTVNKMFRSLKIFINGEEVDGLHIDARTVFENFIEFLHGDKVSPKQRDHLHIGEALVVRNRLTQWMRSSRVTWENLPARCKKVQKQVCQEVGISEPTLRKAICFAKKL